MENGRMSVICASAMHTFVFFCRVKQMSVSVIQVREQLNIFGTIPIIPVGLQCSETSNLNVDGLLIAHVLLVLIADQFNVDCEYWIKRCPPLQSM